jgi:hypothetical protein
VLELACIDVAGRQALGDAVEAAGEGVEFARPRFGEAHVEVAAHHRGRARAQLAEGGQHLPAHPPGQCGHHQQAGHGAGERDVADVGVGVGARGARARAHLVGEFGQRAQAGEQRVQRGVDGRRLARGGVCSDLFHLAEQVGEGGGQHAQAQRRGIVRRAGVEHGLERGVLGAPPGAVRWQTLVHHALRGDQQLGQRVLGLRHEARRGRGACLHRRGIGQRQARAEHDRHHGGDGQTEDGAQAHRRSVRARRRGAAEDAVGSAHRSEVAGDNGR